MKIEHIAQRLDALADWMTPGLKPQTPHPMSVHTLCRDAAAALRRLSADLNDKGNVESVPHRRITYVSHEERTNRDSWPHWCVFDPGAQEILFATSKGKNAAARMATQMIKDERFERLRIRPVMLIGEALPGETVTSHAPTMTNSNYSE